MLAVCRDMLAYAGSSIYSFWRVQNKRVHAAPATGCQMNRLIFCLLGGILVAFSSTLFCHVQPRCEKPYVETNSHLARRMRCLEFAPEIPWVLDSPNRWYRGVRDMAPERAMVHPGKIQSIQVMCFKTLPTTWSRNRLLSYESSPTWRGRCAAGVHQQRFSFINALKKDDKHVRRISLITNHPVVNIHICETVA